MLQLKTLLTVLSAGERVALVSQLGRNKRKYTFKISVVICIFISLPSTK